MRAVVGFLNVVPGIAVAPLMLAEVLGRPCCGIGILDAAWIRCAIPSD